MKELIKNYKVNIAVTYLMLNVVFFVLASVIMPSVVRLNVIVLSVAAAKNILYTFCTISLGAYAIKLFTELMNTEAL